MSAERFDISTLLAMIKEVRWEDDYVELRFGPAFDASYIFIIDSDRVRRRVGNREDLRMLHQLRLRFCACKDANGSVITRHVIATLQMHYTRAHGGIAKGKNWLRFAVPSGTQRVFLFDLVGDQAVGEEFTRT